MDLRSCSSQGPELNGEPRLVSNAHTQLDLIFTYDKLNNGAPKMFTSQSQGTVNMLGSMAKGNCVRRWT